MSQAPVNYRPIGASAEKIQADAAYALSIAETYLESFPGGARFLKGKVVLEIGPGVNFGTMLVLKALGARKVFVADRFLSGYQEDYHTPVYAQLKHLLLRKHPYAHGAVFDFCIQTNSHDEDSITCKECPLEELALEYSSGFDITLSNAVFEHLYDPLEAFRSLRQLTAEGGVGYHQVDCRDHRDFSRPLEYLCHDEFTFNKLLHGCHAECGNRLRPHEMRALFETAGFGRVEFRPNIWAESSYLEEFVPRLRRALASPYSQMGEKFLHEISGQFCLAR